MRSDRGSARRVRKISEPETVTTEARASAEQRAVLHEQRWPERGRRLRRLTAGPWVGQPRLERGDNEGRDLRARRGVAVAQGLVDSERARHRGRNSLAAIGFSELLLPAGRARDCVVAATRGHDAAHHSAVMLGMDAPPARQEHEHGRQQGENPGSDRDHLEPVYTIFSRALAAGALSPTRAPSRAAEGAPPRAPGSRRGSVAPARPASASGLRAANRRALARAPLGRPRHNPW